MKINTFKQITFGVVVILTTLTAVSACKKDKEETNHDPMNSATITIISPKQDTIFNKGDTVRILAQVKAVEDLHGYEITIRNKASSAVVFTTNDEAHDKDLTISEFWVNNVTGLSQMEAEVMVVLDHEKNTASKKITFQCNP